MADRGVLFSAPMILTLLAGRKTQTRRLAKEVEMAKVREGDIIISWPADQVQRTGAAFRPAYLVGDRLWVREDWSIHAAFDGIRASDVKAGSMLYTRADGIWHNAGDVVGEPFGRRRASMHMPRKLSRITLNVTDVRVERLQSISETDAQAEGLYVASVFGPGALDAGKPASWQPYDGWDDGRLYSTGKEAYAALWDSLQPREGERWQDNPWVAAYSFDVSLGNIDEAQS